MAHSGKSIARKSVSNRRSDSASANDCLANVSWKHSNSYQGIVRETVDALRIILSERCEPWYLPTGFVCFSWWYAATI